MSIDTRLDSNLSHLAALERQGLDGRPALEGGVPASAITEATAAEGLLRTPAVDDGELYLAASAWGQDDAHTLDTGAFQLGGGDLGQDLEAGVEGMVALLD